LPDPKEAASERSITARSSSELKLVSRTGLKHRRTRNVPAEALPVTLR
jgi:hypothetical protein